MAIVRQYPVNAPGRARLGSRLVSAVIRQESGQAASYIRLRSQAAGDSFAPPLGLLQRQDKEVARTQPRSRIVRAAPIVTAQGAGTIRLRATAVGTSIEVLSTSVINRAVAPINNPRPARLPSRIRDERTPVGFQFGSANGLVRLRSTANATVVVQAQAIGRVRLWAGAYGSPPAERYLAARAVRPNTPRPARLGTRIQKDARPIDTGVVVTAQMHGRIRVRSRADGSTFIPKTTVLTPTGTVYIAPIGTPGPHTLDEALDPAFLDLGFITDEGLKITNDIALEPKSSWTSLYPKAYIIVGRDVVVEFSLLEWNKRAVEFALDGNVAKNSTEWKHAGYNASATSKSMVIDAVDGDDKLRYYFPVGIVTADLESTASREDAAELPVAFSATQIDSLLSPFRMWRNQPIGQPDLYDESIYDDDEGTYDGF